MGHTLSRDYRSTMGVIAHQSVTVGTVQSGEPVSQRVWYAQDPIPPDEDLSWELVSTVVAQIDGMHRLIWTWVHEYTPSDDL